MRIIWKSLDSDKHKELKKLAITCLKNNFGVSDQVIYEEFPIGPYKFDIIAYPNRSYSSSKELSIIAVECGNIKANNTESLLVKISDILHFVDFIIWVPYDIHSSIFEDTLTRDISEFDLHKVTIPLEEDIYGLGFCKGDTYKKLKESGQEFILG